MTYTLKLVQKPAYLHAVVEGLNNRENVIGYLEELLAACIVRGASFVLIEERLIGPRLDTMDIFNIVSESSRRTIGKIKALAYVDVHAEGDMMHFAETVAVNRGIPVAVFQGIAEAQKWLQKTMMSS